MLLLFLFAAMSFAGNHEPDRTGYSISRIAEQYLDTKPRLSMEACNGLVLDILSDAGVEMKGRVDSLWQQSQTAGWVHHRKRPQAGDLVFWHKTYDRNRNGKVDDRFTHIGVVIRVDANKTVHMVHRGSRGIRALKMNLYHPDDYRVNGEIVNDYIAASGYGKKNERLTGQLFAGFATIGHQTSRPVLGKVRTVAVSPSTTKAPPRKNTAQKTPGINPTKAEWEVLHPRLRRRILKGRGIYRRQLRKLNCKQIWAVRNAIFARHGYAFKNASAKNYFQAQDWYKSNAEVSKRTVAGYLSAMDYENLEVVVRVEKRLCHLNEKR